MWLRLKSEPQCQLTPTLASKGVAKRMFRTLQKTMQSFALIGVPFQKPWTQHKLMPNLALVRFGNKSGQGIHNAKHYHFQHQMALSGRPVKCFVIKCRKWHTFTLTCEGSVCYTVWYQTHGQLVLQFRLKQHYSVPHVKSNSVTKVRQCLSAPCHTTEHDNAPKCHPSPPSNFFHWMPSLCISVCNCRKNGLQQDLFNLLIIK